MGELYSSNFCAESGRNSDEIRMYGAGSRSYLEGLEVILTNLCAKSGRDPDQIWA